MRKIPSICRGPHWQVTATLADIGNGWKLIELEPDDTTEEQFGLAIDIGTTTVVVYLVDLCDGTVLSHPLVYCLPSITGVALIQ